MLHGKKKKIAEHLKEKEAERSVFDLLLSEYLSGDLQSNLKRLGLSKIEIHIDWFDDIKSLGIQAKYSDRYLDIQIDENELAIGCSKDEPDCDEFLALNGANDTHIIYNAIQRRIKCTP